jgi:hypothetical protein
LSEREIYLSKYTHTHTHTHTIGEAGDIFRGHRAAVE